jgi:hypothetical protein
MVSKCTTNNQLQEDGNNFQLLYYQVYRPQKYSLQHNTIINYCYMF